MARHAGLVPEAPSGPSWQPWCWSASGARILARYGTLRSGSLAIYDTSSGSLNSIGQGGPQHSVGFFEGEELVLFALCQIWRTRLSEPPVFAHPPRGVEWALAHENLIAALGRDRLLLIDRNTTPRPSPPDRTPDTRRLRVVDHTQQVPVVRELQRWTHSEAEGEPMVAISADGHRAMDGVLGRPVVRVWDLDAAALLESIDLTEEGDGATSLAISSDGRVLAPGTARGRVLRFELD